MGDIADEIVDWMWDASYDEWYEEGGYFHPPCHAGDPCPKGCGGTLVVKCNRTTGEPFLGCSSFPKCKGY